MIDDSKLDPIASDVRKMYAKYPFPALGNYEDYFVRKVLPTIRKLREKEPIIRILDAGCGTGWVTCDIADSLPEAEVVGADFTSESLRLASERAKNRGLTNVRFCETNLLEHNPELGTFDFVVCMGVLHHLSDPFLGMCNLNRYLRNSGHAFIWLYSLLGRRWILDMREALQSILKGKKATDDEKLKIIRGLLVATGLTDTDGSTGYFELFLPVHEAETMSQSLTHRTTGKLLRLLEKLRTEGLLGMIAHIGNRTKGRRMSENVNYQNVHLMDMLLHPKDKFYRFREAVSQFEDAGFEFIDVLDGMRTSLPKALTAAYRMDGDKIDRYEAIELIEKPSGIGYLFRKAHEWVPPSRIEE